MWHSRLLSKAGRSYAEQLDDERGFVRVSTTVWRFVRLNTAGARGRLPFLSHPSIWPISSDAMLPPVLATPIWVVSPKHLAQHLKDLLLPSVLTAPVMILMMENAALDAIRDFLESAAGAVIDLERFAKRLAAKSNRA